MLSEVLRKYLFLACPVPQSQTADGRCGFDKHPGHPHEQTLRCQKDSLRSLESSQLWLVNSGKGELSVMCDGGRETAIPASFPEHCPWAKQAGFQGPWGEACWEAADEPRV